jgi:hypothetical protein
MSTLFNCKVLIPQTIVSGSSKNTKHIPLKTRDILARWFGTYRWVYNEIVAFIKKDFYTMKTMNFNNKDTVECMKEMFTVFIENKIKDNKWMKDTPRSIIDNSIDLVICHLQKRKLERIKFLKKKSQVEVIWINAHDYNFNYHIRDVLHECVYNGDDLPPFLSQDIKLRRENDLLYVM